MTDHPPAPTDPTVADATAIGTSGAAAAQTGAAAGLSRDEVKAAMREAMAEERDTRNVAMSDDDVSKVADAMMSRFEQAGAFADPPPAAAGPAASSDAAVQTAAAAGQAPTASAAAPAGDQQPVKGSFADRFLK